MCKIETCIYNIDISKTLGIKHLWCILTLTLTVRGAIKKTLYLKFRATSPAPPPPPPPFLQKYKYITLVFESSYKN